MELRLAFFDPAHPADDLRLTQRAWKPTLNGWRKARSFVEDYVSSLDPSHQFMPCVVLVLNEMEAADRGA